MALKYTEYTAVYDRLVTGNCDVFTMTTVVNSPAAMWALVYCPLRTIAANIVQPDPSRTDAETVVYFIADVPARFGKIHER